MGPVGLVFWQVVTNDSMPATQVFRTAFASSPAMICAGIATIGARVVRLGSELGLEQSWSIAWRSVSAPAGWARYGWRGMKCSHGPLPSSSFTPRSSIIRMLSPASSEARATARLASPHTVRLYDYSIGKILYYAMELLEGMDLNTLVQSHGPVSPERAAHFLRQTCESLAEAHEPRPHSPRY